MYSEDKIAHGENMKLAPHWVNIYPIEIFVLGTILKAISINVR